MADVVHWEIAGQSYPFTLAFKWRELRLVRELTGLSWEEFEAPINALRQQSGNGDASLSAETLLGLIAVGVWRENPGWSRNSVRKFVEELDMDAAELVTPDEDDEEEDDPGPPVMTAGATSSTSADKSESESEPTSTSSTRQPSGTQTSPTSPEEPSD